MLTAPLCRLANARAHQRHKSANKKVDAEFEISAWDTYDIERSKELSEKSKDVQAKPDKLKIPLEFRASTQRERPLTERKPLYQKPKTPSLEVRNSNRVFRKAIQAKDRSWIAIRSTLYTNSSLQKASSQSKRAKANQLQILLSDKHERIPFSEFIKNIENHERIMRRKKSIRITPRESYDFTFNRLRLE